jgi:hypothetical protein
VLKLSAQRFMTFSNTQKHFKVHTKTLEHFRFFLDFGSFLATYVTKCVMLQKVFARVMLAFYDIVKTKKKQQMLLAKQK